MVQEDLGSRPSAPQSFLPGTLRGLLTLGLAALNSSLGLGAPGPCTRRLSRKTALLPGSVETWAFNPRPMPTSGVLFFLPSHVRFRMKPDGARRELWKSSLHMSFYPQKLLECLF